jgi:hypothetical protein
MGFPSQAGALKGTPVRKKAPWLDRNVPNEIADRCFLAHGENA